jgi:hypothetical protein
VEVTEETKRKRRKYRKYPRLVYTPEIPPHPASQGTWLGREREGASMRTTSKMTKTRCVRYDRSSKSKPWEAVLHIAGKRKRVGRYETGELAEAAVQGARRAVPTLPPGRPRMPQEKRQAIVDTYRQVKSQAKAATIHRVNESTVRRILREVRPKLEDYPDFHYPDSVG